VPTSLVLIVIAAATVAAWTSLNVWATVVVARGDLSKEQRTAQLCFVWLLPIVGALMVLAISREGKAIQKRGSGEEEPHMYVSQAARAQARVQQRAVEVELERAIVNSVSEAIETHGSSSPD
jgi:formate/nitrite transporter FocA (FNT family)